MSSYNRPKTTTKEPSALLSPLSFLSHRRVFTNDAVRRSLSLCSSAPFKILFSLVKGRKKDCGFESHHARYTTQRLGFFFFLLEKNKPEKKRILTALPQSLVLFWSLARSSTSFPFSHTRLASCRVVLCRHLTIDSPSTRVLLTFTSLEFSSSFCCLSQCLSMGKRRNKNSR